MATRRRFSNVFKRMVVEECFFGSAAQAQLATRYNLSPHLIMRWLKDYVDQASDCSMATVHVFQMEKSK